MYGNFLCRSDDDKTRGEIVEGYIRKRDDTRNEDKDQDKGCDIATYDFDAQNSFSKVGTSSFQHNIELHKFMNHTVESRVIGKANDLGMENDFSDASLVETTTMVRTIEAFVKTTEADEGDDVLENQDKKKDNGVKKIRKRHYRDTLVMGDGDKGENSSNDAQNFLTSNGDMLVINKEWSDGKQDGSKGESVVCDLVQPKDYPAVTVLKWELKLEQERSGSLLPTLGLNGIRDSGEIFECELPDLNQILQQLTLNSNMMTNSGGTTTYSFE